MITNHPPGQATICTTASPEIRVSGLRSHERDRARESLTAEVTATASHNQPTGLTTTTDHGEVGASDLGLSLN
jgi:hypothetical protein